MGGWKAFGIPAPVFLNVGLVDFGKRFTYEKCELFVWRRLYFLSFQYQYFPLAHYYYYYYDDDYYYYYDYYYCCYYYCYCYCYCCCCYSY